MPPLDYLLFVFVCILFICMFIFLTENEWGEKPKIYSKGYVILFVFMSFVPYLNVVLAIVLPIIYIMARVTDTLRLKRTKFTEKWFGMSNND